MFFVTKLIRGIQSKKVKRSINKLNSQSARYRIFNFLIFLFILVIINSIVLVKVENISYADAFWLSATTITTVGYGDISPVTTTGRLSTIICLYLFGIGVLSQLIAEFINIYINNAERKRKGLWECKYMSGHIQIINTPNNDTEAYLKKLINQIRSTPKYADCPIQLLTRKYPDGLPDSLQDQKILLRTGVAEDKKTLESLNLNEAESIIILTRDVMDTLADSLTFDILSRLQEMNIETQTIVEVVNDHNRERFKKVGADVVLRPVRAYPEMVVRAMSAPGTEVILEDLFHHSNNHLEHVEYNFDKKSWSEILVSYIETGKGLPLGYIDKEGKVNSNPSLEERVSGNTLIVLVNESHTSS